LKVGPAGSAVRYAGRRTFLSAHVIGVLPAWLQIDETVRSTQRPRRWAGEGFRCTSNRV